MAFSMLKIRRPLGRLIFNMGIAIPGKTVFLIETAPWIYVDNNMCCLGPIGLYQILLLYLAFIHEYYCHIFMFQFIDHFVIVSNFLNTLWIGDAVWQHWLGSRVAPIKASCLAAPCYYLNQCWFLISEVLWLSPSSQWVPLLIYCMINWKW